MLELARRRPSPDLRTALSAVRRIKRSQLANRFSGPRHLVLVCLLAPLLLTGCVRVSGLGGLDGKYSLDCIKESRLQEDIEPYRTQIEQQQDLLTRAIETVEDTDLWLQQSTTYEGEPGTGSCRVVTNAELRRLERPFLACDRDEAQVMPYLLCDIGDIKVYGCSEVLGELGLEGALGRRATDFCRDLARATDNETAVAAMRNILIDAGLKATIDMAVEGMQQGDFGENASVAVLASLYALERERQCWQKTSQICTKLQQDYEYAKSFIGRAHQLTALCRRRVDRRDEAMAELRQARTELAQLESEVAPLVEELEQVHNRMASTGVDCGD